MVPDNFDPAAWLARWKAAGGAWAISVIFRPRRHADDAALDRLCAELDEGRRQALLAHLSSTAE